MLSKEEIEKAIIWVKERIEYIIQNCDLKDEDNKRALENLKIINICLQENNKQNKIIDEMAEYIVELIKFNNWEELREVEEVKQYFEKKVDEENEHYTSNK